jgi:hypothetical protein
MERGEYTARVRRNALRKNKHTRNSQATNVLQSLPGREERIALDSMRYEWDGRGRDAFLLLYTARKCGIILLVLQ